eukprot:349944-Chlamydomonas_euryale.AAC.2
MSSLGYKAWWWNAHAPVRAAPAVRPPPHFPQTHKPPPAAKHSRRQGGDQSPLRPQSSQSIWRRGECREGRGCSDLEHRAAVAQEGGKDANRGNSARGREGCEQGLGSGLTSKPDMDGVARLAGV